MERVRNLTQAYSQTPWRKQLKFVVLFLLCVVFIALIAGIYLDVTARAATIGREILYMRSEIAELELTNASLTTELAVLTSAKEMKTRALDLGFVSVEKGEIMYVLVPGYVPPQQPHLAPPPKPTKVIAANLPADYRQSLIDWFREQVVPTISRAVEVSP
ncbi:MAG: hypothetical protein JSV61_01565 [Anaerolineales bacterium]|nr:MAG: hypothetical protein JSV61_01565 [Anaerolineales bacterium]